VYSADTILKAAEIIIEVLHWQAPKKRCSCSESNTEPCRYEGLYQALYSHI
jgi:hypothetical protein